MRKRHTPLSRLPAVCECGAHGFARLPRGFVTLFSPDKLPLVAGRIWGIMSDKNRRYAVASPGHGVSSILMHRKITGAERHAVVDHANGDGLDNQDHNLRVCTASKNGQNARPRINKAVPFKGVYFSQGAFCAQISRGPGQNQEHLGTFSCPIEAARAYDRVALDRFGEFALTNAMLGLIPADPTA